jgi:hypothetical protein
MLETAKVAASIANTHPGPTPATSTPEIVGPATNATLRERLMSAFACWRRSARTTSATKPVEAGEKKASPAPKSAKRTTSCQRRACPVTSSVATRAWEPVRSTSAASITRCRGQRSATTPPRSRNTTRETNAAARTSPSADAEPVSSMTAKASATGTRLDPSAEVACPSHRSLNSRCSSAPSLAATAIPRSCEAELTPG